MAIKIGRVSWPGPVGIGAGIIKGTGAFLDLSKKADSVEVGSVTKRPCMGNAGQTVWKYPKEKALRHNAGLPNPGAKGLVTQLKTAAFKTQIPWGISVAVTPGIKDKLLAADDAADTVEAVLSGGLRPDWITLNVSSPDTTDAVDELTEPTRVQACIQAIRQVNHLYNLPLWLKVGLNLKPEWVKTLSDLAIALKLDALVVGNALPDPNGLPGGWCGLPVRAHMLASVWQFAQVTQGRVPLVAMGGIQTGMDVKEAMGKGATAVQIASAVIFRGREAAQEIRREYELIDL